MRFFCFIKTDLFKNPKIEKEKKKFIEEKRNC
jgi:hypothetical protein